MPFEDLEQEGLEKNPNLELAQYKFLLTTDEYKNDAKLKKDLLSAIEHDSKWYLASVHLMLAHLITKQKWLSASDILLSHREISLLVGSRYLK